MKEKSERIKVAKVDADPDLFGDKKTFELSQMSREHSPRVILGVLCEGKNKIWIMRRET